jgi:hypothetical protein
MTEANQEMGNSNGWHGSKSSSREGKWSKTSVASWWGIDGRSILRIKSSLSAIPPVGFEFPIDDCQIAWLHRTRQSQCNSSCQ